MSRPLAGFNVHPHPKLSVQGGLGEHGFPPLRPQVPLTLFQFVVGLAM